MKVSNQDKKQRAPGAQWKRAYMRAGEYRAWSNLLGALTFWLAIATLVTGDQVIEQLTISGLVGAVFAWASAREHDRAAVELRGKDHEDDGRP